MSPPAIAHSRASETIQKFCMIQPFCLLWTNTYNEARQPFILWSMPGQRARPIFQIREDVSSLGAPWASVPCPQWADLDFDRGGWPPTSTNLFTFRLLSQNSAEFSESVPQRGSLISRHILVRFQARAKMQTLLSLCSSQFLLCHLAPAAGIILRTSWFQLLSQETSTWHPQQIRIHDFLRVTFHHRVECSSTVAFVFFPIPPHVFVAAARYNHEALLRILPNQCPNFLKVEWQVEWPTFSVTDEFHCFDKNVSTQTHSGVVSKHIEVVLRQELIVEKSVLKLEAVSFQLPQPDLIGDSGRQDRGTLQHLWMRVALQIMNDLKTKIEICFGLLRQSKRTIHPNAFCERSIFTWPAVIPLVSASLTLSRVMFATHIFGNLQEENHWCCKCWTTVTDDNAFFSQQNRTVLTCTTYHRTMQAVLSSVVNLKVTWKCSTSSLQKMAVEQVFFATTTQFHSVSQNERPTETRLADPCLGSLRSHAMEVSGNSVTRLFRSYLCKRKFYSSSPQPRTRLCFDQWNTFLIQKTSQMPNVRQVLWGKTAETFSASEDNETAFQSWTQSWYHTRESWTHSRTFLWYTKPNSRRCCRVFKWFSDIPSVE